jgi:hypothetical protein
LRAKDKKSKAFRGIMALKCGWNEFLDNSATAVWLLTALICGYYINGVPIWIEKSLKMHWKQY